MDTVGISNFELQATIATFYFKNPSDSKKIPKLYAQMYEGDFSAIASNVMIMKRYVLNRLSAMPFAMDMQSGISDKRKKIVAAQLETTILGSSVNFLLYEWMTGIDFPQLPDDFRKLKKNKVNALLLSGSMDGRTYLTSGRDIAKKFKKGQHVVIENAGHDLYMQSPLISELVVSFFKGEKLTIKRIELKPILFD